MAKKHLFDYKGVSPRVTPWKAGSKPPLPLVYSQHPMGVYGGVSKGETDEYD
jgi:hypothetical protein